MDMNGDISTEKRTNEKSDWLTRLTVVQCVICAVLTALLLTVKRLAPNSFAQLGKAYNGIMCVDFSSEQIKTAAKKVFSFVLLPAKPVSAEPETSAEPEEAQTTAVPAAGGEEIALLDALDSATFSPVYLTDKLVMPLDSYELTSPFGYRIHPVSGKWSFHSGVDLSAKKGSAIMTVLDGTVTETGCNDQRGNYIIVSHSKSLKTAYLHCDKIIADTGDRVESGEKIATVGSTGISTGPHLHFELIVDGLSSDPACVLEFEE